MPTTTLTTTTNTTPDPAESVQQRAFPIVGVGASAGGLEAFTQLLAALPIDTGMAFVLVQHLDPVHESALTQILARATSLPVLEITADQRVEPNHVYVIPPDASLTIANGVFTLAARRRIRGPQRPIDSFFVSLAHDQRERAVGVVLSGTANDGTAGLEAIKAEGGLTFAQNDSAKYDSMPRSAVAAGCVDLVLSPAEIAHELARIAKHPYLAGQPLEFSATAKAAPSSDTQIGMTDEEPEVVIGTKITVAAYKSVLLLLRNHTGVDFSHYKSSTILRRMTRRVLLNRQDSLSDYAGFIRGNPSELDALYADVLINVTSFFRNPETFEDLKHRIVPQLLALPGDEPLRCWVLGCSTGQEAYSIAITFLEASEKAPRMRTLQIFATDLSAAVLEKARHGLYADDIAQDVSPERLRRFFVKETGGYRVCKPLREMVVFAQHNLIADPPFSRMDLISCRNLLIYLEPSLQKKAIPTFHYALRPHGFLVLGASESVSGFADLFEPLDKKNKIYARKSSPTLTFHLPVRRGRGEEPLGRQPALPLPTSANAHDGPPIEFNAQREADRITVNQFAPPGVLVNADLQVLQFRGATDAFLEAPTGKASFDVLKMAREGLMLPLRSALAESRESDKTARRNKVRLVHNGKTRDVNVEVIPLKNLRERCFLILFEESGKVRAARAAPELQATRADHLRGHARLSRITELEGDLSEMRAYLQSVQEQHQAATEELQSANEEVQSTNEEMQSVNEELETSKEELESTNEELTTVNEEMSFRNVELNRLNNDLTNLQNSTKLAIVLLGRDLTIRHFTPEAATQFALQANDVGRPIRHIQHNLMRSDDAGRDLDLEGMAAEVVSGVREQEHQVYDKGGRAFSLSVRPYITLENSVDGVVLVLTDINDRKRAERSDTHLAAIVSSSNDAIMSKDLGGTIQSWNRGAQRLFGYTAAEVIGKVATLLVPGDRADEEVKILEQVRRGETVEHYETVRRRKDGSLVDISLTVSPVRDPTGRVAGSATIARDITDRKGVEDALRRRGRELTESEERRNEFLAMLGHELRNPLSALVHGLELMGEVRGDERQSEELRTMMVKQTKRIGTLLDQLLDMARVISGKVVLLNERVDLAEVIRTTLESVKLFADTKARTLTVTLPPGPSICVIGDAVRLTQMLENLLTNAVKYTHDGGEVRVTLASDGDKARITVADTGVGMTADFLQHAFDVFTQAERSLHRSKGGLGLGLALVRRLAAMHGGQVEAASPGLGQGSTFIVTLPRLREAKPADPHTKASSRTPTGGQPRRILVVDDEKEMASAFVSLLERRGHTVVGAYDGTAALAALRTFDAEVAIIDLGLPEMDGYELALRIRAEHGDKQMLLIAASGYLKDPALLTAAGFDEYLMKPVRREDLMAVLAAWQGWATASP